jgi:tetratricopeptide (TPR) repeat protein
MRTPPPRWTVAAVGVTGLALAAVAVVTALSSTTRPESPSPALAAVAASGQQAGASASGSSGSAATGPDGAAALRARVARVPGDWPAWSALGAAELERGRASGEPAAYAAAAQAFDRSLRVHPEGNDAALAGQAALEAARHRFADAERTARRALAVNPDSPQALATLTDALTELGRYPDALATAERLDQLKPGVASFARLSYQAELRGRIPDAIALMARAASEASTPAQVAFARAIEGTLRLGNGDVAGAEGAWRAGTAAAPQDVALLRLGARIAWTHGDRELAARGYADVMARRPSAADAAAQAEVLTALGRTREAAVALEVARAAQTLARDAGIELEAGDVLLEADHGDAGQAVVLGAQLWGRSPSVGAADAYAWALHAAGRDADALPYADRALSIGGRPAAVLAHRGTIRAALGDRTGAIADLRAALAADPAFSPAQVPRAAELLRSLAGVR